MHTHDTMECMTRLDMIYSQMFHMYEGKFPNNCSLNVQIFDFLYFIYILYKCLYCHFDLMRHCWIKVIISLKKNNDPKLLNGNVARSISNTKPSGQTYDEQYHTL